MSRMPNRYAAFISYAHRYQEWVAALRRNLESCLRAAGADPSEIFLDHTDLTSGRSWVAQLQEGLSRSDQLILVATPESLASARTEDEVGSFIAGRPDWAKGSFHLVQLVDAPLPLFLEQLQRLDFIEHDDRQYSRELRRTWCRSSSTPTSSCSIGSTSSSTCGRRSGG